VQYVVLLGAVVLTAVIVGRVRLMRQCRKPARARGEQLARAMNIGHADLTNWGLEQFAIAPNATILEVGCGGGKTIQRLLGRAPDGKVFGIDYSAASVAVSTETNAAEIAGGRVEVRQGTVSSLPYAPDTFDLVAAVETHYYWPDLTADLAGIRRVLKPGGRMVIIAEAFRGMHSAAKDTVMLSLVGVRLLSPDEHRDALVGAGFAEVRVIANGEKGWICAMGTKH
jgi:SAM-dependent methyltransferase